MFKTIAHHTLEKTKDSKSKCEINGPVLSKLYISKGKLVEYPPFAGEGYYFWDNNIDMAHYWGYVRYLKKRKHYRILSLILDVSDKDFFDLVGSRQNIIHFMELLNHVKTVKGSECKNWKLYQFIAHLRDIDKETPGIFPYNVLRFNDTNINRSGQKNIHFNEKNKMIINPNYIICVFNMNKLNRESLECIYESNTKNAI